MLLVTGITGQTGRYFLQELVENNYEGPIRCIVRETSDTSLLDISGLTIEKIVGDLENKELIERAMDGVVTVMHIYNIHHSPMIVNTAIKNKVKRTILVHTTGIYSNYKRASEEYKRIEKKISVLTGAPNCITSVTILRPSMIYGDVCDSNMSKFIRMIDKIRIIPVINGGKSLVQPVNARDLGKAFYNVLMSPNETVDKDYELTGEKPITMIEVFKLISKELNKKTVFVNVSLKMSVFIARIIKILTLNKVNLIEQVQRMEENRSYSHDAATLDFGYCPISFEKGIRVEVKEYIHKKKIYKQKL